MYIKEYYSFTATKSDNLIVDMIVSIDGSEERVEYVYRASDPYSPLTPLITQWLSDNPDQEILPYIPPPELTPEELRAQMPPLSRRQFWLGAHSLGVAKADVMAYAANDPALLIEVEESTEFQRTYGAVTLLSPLLGITDDQLDDVWMWFAAA
ncbi:hypothetical protein MP213Fo_05170 [Pseudochrobactrum sp. MP213Fo]